MNRRPSEFVLEVRDYLNSQGYSVYVKTKQDSVFHFVVERMGIYAKESGAINVNERNAILSEAELRELIPYVAYKNAKGEIELKEVR